MSTIASLVVQIAADTTQLVRNVEESTAMLETFSSVAETTAGVLGIGLGVTAIGEAVRGFGEMTHQLENGARAIGTTTDALQEMRFAAQEAGVDVDTLTSGMERLEQRIGSGKANDALVSMGLSLQEIRSSDPADLFTSVAQAIAAIADPLDRAAKAQEVFGKSGITMLPLLTSNIDAARQKAEELGLVMNKAAIEAGATFNRSLNELTTTFKVLSGSILSEVTPAISTFVDWIMKAAGAAKDSGFEVSYFGIRLKDVQAVAAAFGLTTLDLPPAVAPASTAIHDLAIQVQTLDDAFDMQRTAGQYLTDQVQEQIRAAEKHKAAVDGIVSSLLGETAKTHETIEALTQLARSGVDNVEVTSRMEEAIHRLEDAGVDLNDTLYTFEVNNRTLAGSLDTLQLHIGQLVARVPDLTGHVAEMGTAFDDVRSAIQTTTFAMDVSAGKTASQVDIDEVWHQKLVQVRDDLDRAATAQGIFTASIEEALKATPNLLVQAFTSGGGIAGAVQALGTKFGSDLGKHLVGAPGEGGFADTLTNTFGDTLGGIIGSAIPAVGALIGPLLGKLFSIGGPSQAELQGRQVEASFEQQFGSFQQMMTAVGKTYDATGRSAQQAQMDVKALMDAERLGGDAAKAAMDKINSAFSEQAQDTQDLQAAIQRYNFSLAELGPTMQKQQLDQQAQQLINDWRLLVNSGIDVVTVDQHMATSMNDYLAMVRKTGQEVPIAMQPILQKMIDQGDLTDDAGNKITDLSQIGVSFSMTMTEGFQKVVDKLDQLLQKIGMVPAAIAAIPTSIDLSANVSYNTDNLPRDVIPMAGGGSGRAIGPTLFYSAGNEDFAFSGEGRAFGGGGSKELLAAVRNLPTTDDFRRLMRDAIALAG